jgi:hypothetical protein
MKVTCLSVLLLATSAVARRNGVKTDARRRTRGLKTGDKDMGMSKGMSKGSKGMKGMGMKDKDANGCQSLKIYGFYSEAEAGFGQTAVGETITFPIYDYYTDEPIGTYVDSSTDAFVGGEFVDCTFAGSFNFGFDSSLDFPFTSQVLVAGTCLGDSNAITGGTGKYSCAAGSETFLEDTEDVFTSDLKICNTCPH